MRSLLLFVLGAASVFAQPITAGIKGGIPMTDFVNTVQSGTFDYTSTTQRYIIGPMVEFHLPAGLSVEFDALYRHFEYSGAGTLFALAVNGTTTTGNWEFPLLLKYRFHARIARPFIDAGAAWDRLSGLTYTVAQAAGGNPPELRRESTAGFVLGGGVDIHALFLHISPELRYTRWFQPQFNSPAGGLQSNQNQAEFLVGFTF